VVAEAALKAVVVAHLVGVAVVVTK
jgi:hypothetical protein